MNRIILIGNGFDLAHGMKTSYKDFLGGFWRDFINKMGKILNLRLIENTKMNGK